VREEYLRRYPQGSLAAHVLGLRTIDGIGRGGVEQAFDEVLRGKDGRRELVRDARGRVIEVYDRGDEAPVHGRTVVLSIDCVVQLFTERELDALMRKHRPESACAIVVDPRTCDVLAMASRPAFDPNRPVGVAADAWKNTAIASIYEPGSTIKPVIVAWGLEKGLIARDEEFHCEQGVYKMGSRLLHDHHPYGRLSLTDVLVKSSNIGMAKIGERLQNGQLYEALVAFGLGRKTGCGLPGELEGTVRPLGQWTSYSTGSIPMGQELSVTPLQLIAAHAALANGGSLISPRVVLGQTERAGTGDDGRPGEGVYAPVVTRVLAHETAQWVVQGPRVDVVRRGTGTKAQLDGYTVFGKSGTAQKTDPRTGAYSQREHVSSFLCGAPAGNPQVLVLVVVNEPAPEAGHFGGEVAAPAASRILERTLAHLHVPPGVAEEQREQAGPVAERPSGETADE
jgi:cell division protein FtsI/penicillin-binding protein 2